MTDSLPPPPAGDLQCPESFEDALDIFPNGKQISPALPFGGSRWQVLELPEEDGEENATGVALSPVDESTEHAELHQALDGEELLSLTKSIASSAQLGYGRVADAPTSAEPAQPLPPSGELQLPCSFEDALDIFPLCKPISPDLPYGGSRWQVMELPEEDGEESAMLSAAGVAEAMANEPEEQRVHTDAELRQQAREGDEVVSATGITSLSALWTNGSQPHEQAAYRLLQEGDRLVPQHEGEAQLTGPTMDEAFAAACGTAADGTALKKNQAKTPWTKQEDQAILEGVKVHGHKWSKIAETLPSTVPRTDDATRNRWHRLMNKAGRLANDRPANGETDDVSPPKRPRAQPTAAQEAAAEEAAGKGGKHGDMWTAEEDLTIDHAVHPYPNPNPNPNPNPTPNPNPNPKPNPDPNQVRIRGLRWKAVAALLPGRTESGCRNRWVRNQEREFAAAGLAVHGAAAVFAALDAARQQEQQQAAMAS